MEFTAPGEGELAAAEVDGVTVAVAVVDGELRAFEDTCPHAGCSLSEGELTGATVSCPCHFARFDVRTGAVQDGPAPDGVATWPATVVNGALRLGERREPSTSPSQAAPPNAGPDHDVVVLIEREHEAFRRHFDALDRSQDVGEDWRALVQLLEVHASGEERLLYPLLVATAHHLEGETVDAVRDHNEIRDAVRAVDRLEVAGQQWWVAVRHAHAVTEEHLAEEERDLLPTVRDALARAKLEELAQQWVTFHEQHRDARGLSGSGADPSAVVHPHD